MWTTRRFESTEHAGWLLDIVAFNFRISDFRSVGCIRCVSDVADPFAEPFADVDGLRWLTQKLNMEIDELHLFVSVYSSSRRMTSMRDARESGMLSRSLPFWYRSIVVCDNILND